MSDLIKNLKAEDLSPKQKTTYDSLNAKTYDLNFCEKVVKKLKLIGEKSNSKDKASYSKGIVHSHRDYCGQYLIYVDGVYYFGLSNDGYTDEDKVIMSFSSDKDFINWLSSQSDQSFSLFGGSFNNQTITKIRMDYLLEQNNSGSSVWNDYCNYLRFRSYTYKEIPVEDGLKEVLRILKENPNSSILPYNLNGDTYEELFEKRKHLKEALSLYGMYLGEKLVGALFLRELIYSRIEYACFSKDLNSENSSNLFDSHFLFAYARNQLASKGQTCLEVELPYDDKTELNIYDSYKDLELSFNMNKKVFYSNIGFGYMGFLEREDKKRTDLMQKFLIFPDQKLR